MSVKLSLTNDVILLLESEAYISHITIQNPDIGSKTMKALLKLKMK